jgi:hypothetical protein
MAKLVAPHSLTSFLAPLNTLSVFVHENLPTTFFWAICGPLPVPSVIGPLEENVFVAHCSLFFDYSAKWVSKFISFHLVHLLQIIPMYEIER